MKTISGSEVTRAATWSAADIGDQTGRIALVTGANSGIGYETARALAAHGAHVILACRDDERARRARDKMESELDRSSLELLHLDLADLVSVHRAADVVLAEHARLDMLVNNAGVMGTPYRQTADGFELQMATNHLGHFALTGLLLDRIVTTATVAHRHGELALAPHGTAAARRRRRRSVPQHLGRLRQRPNWPTCSSRPSSAVACTRPELPTLALAAHPGWTRSNLAGSGAALGNSRVRRRLGRLAGSTLGQSTAGGALPVLCAATSSSVGPGQYIGPARLFGLYGPPKVALPSRRARDLQDGGSPVGGVRGADRRQLLGGRPGLSLPWAGPACPSRRRDPS